MNISTQEFQEFKNKDLFKLKNIISTYDIDEKAKNEIMQLINNTFIVNDITNNRIIQTKKGKINFYNRVKCNDMIKGVYYIIDPKYFYSRLELEFPDENFISNTHIIPMKFDKIDEGHCKFISEYGNNTFFRMDKCYFYNTIDDECSAIEHRSTERTMMKLILNRFCFLGKIAINEIVNDFL